MKVLIINYYYYPNMVGGTEQSVKLLAEGIVDDGIETAVFTYDGNEISQDNIEGVVIFRDTYNTESKGVRSQLMRCYNTFWNSKHYANLDTIVSHFNPDVVNVNNLFYMSPSIWRFFSKKKIPVIHTIRDQWLEFPFPMKTRCPKILLSSLTFVWQRFICRLSNKYISYVTAPSQYMMEKFISMGYFRNAKRAVIPNSINLDIDETRRIIAEKNLRSSSDIHYLYVGQLVKHKGILNLLEVWSSLPDKDITLPICGDGPLKEMVLSASENDSRIRYTGQLTKEVLKEQYIAADILIVPSIWEETFGRVIIEGNQYGTPVIGSNRGGIPEVLSETGGGITFQYDSLYDLKHKILLFKNRDVIRYYMNPILDNIEKYQNSNNIDRYIQLYSEAGENSLIK
jgi:glycosyltransferase involved in cell wall biosynthesis